MSQLTYKEKEVMKEKSNIRKVSFKPSSTFGIFRHGLGFNCAFASGWRGGRAEKPFSPERLLVPSILVYSKYCFWNITQRVFKLARND